VVVRWAVKIARVNFRGTITYGLLEGQGVRLAKGDPFRGLEPLERWIPLKEVKLLPPVQPSKIIGIGLNYRDHAEEVGLPPPDEPLVFLKPPSAVIGPDDPILLPPSSQRVDYEGELALIVSRRAKDITPDEAPDYILGYTCFNDVTARDIQEREGQWTRAKGFDTFAPLGPWIATDLDPTDLRIETFLNGELRQSSRTSRLIFDPFGLLAFISRVMTLLPGDVIATGTPSGIGSIKPGDVVEVRIEGIGVLRNPVRSYLVPSSGTA